MKTFLILALLITVTATTAIPKQQLPVPQQPSVQTVPQPQEPSIPPSPQQQQQPQQLIPCRDFLMQKCSPARRTSPFLWLQMLVLPSLRLELLQKQSNCQVMQERCCGQLAQIDVQSRCGAIWRVAHGVELATIMQQQQQQLGQGTAAIQPQPQHVLETMKLAQTLDEMCRLQDAPYCTKY